MPFTPIVFNRTRHSMITDDSRKVYQAFLDAEQAIRDKRAAWLDLERELMVTRYHALRHATYHCERGTTAMIALESGITATNLHRMLREGIIAAARTILDYGGYDTDRIDVVAHWKSRVVSVVVDPEQVDGIVALFAENDMVLVSQGRPGDRAETWAEAQRRLLRIREILDRAGLDRSLYSASVRNRFPWTEIRPAAVGGELGSALDARINDALSAAGLVVTIVGRTTRAQPSIEGLVELVFGWADEVTE